jgi:hypothetical protein
VYVVSLFLKILINFNLRIQQILAWTFLSAEYQFRWSVSEGKHEDG